MKSCWSSVYIGNPKKLVLISLKGCCSSRIDGLARGSEGKRTKTKFPFSVSLYLGCHQKVLPTFRVGLTNSNNLVKTNPHRRSTQAAWVLADSRCGQVDSKINHHNFEPHWATRSMNSYLERRNEVNYLAGHPLRFLRTGFSSHMLPKSTMKL